MKKNKIINYLIILVVGFFISLSNIKGETYDCNYSIEGKITGSEYENYRSYIQVRKLDKDIMSIKELSQATEDKFFNDYFNIDTKEYDNIVLGFNINYKANSLRFDMIPNGGTYTFEGIKIYGYNGRIAYYQKKLNDEFEKTLHDQNYNDSFTIKNNFCPDAVVVNFSYPFNDMSNFASISLENGFYLSDYNNDIDQLTEHIEKQYANSDYMPLIFYLKETNNDGYNMIDALNGKYCVIKRYTRGFTSNKYPIETIVQKYLDGGFKEMIDQITDINDKKQIQELLAQNVDFLSSFYSKYDISEVSSEIKQLKKFNEDVDVTTCLNRYINSSPTVKYENYYGWYQKYAPNSVEKYVFDLTNVLEILERSEIKNDLVKMNEIKNIKDKIKNCDENDSNCIYDSCIELETYMAKHHCLKNASFDYNKCYSNRVEEGKNKCNNQAYASETIEKAEEEYESAKDEALTTLNRHFNHMFEQNGVDISDSSTDKFCDILYDEENGIGIYIDGGLGLIRIGGPILVIMLTAFDGIKTFASSKDDENKKFFNKLKVRLICLALLFLIPTIINFLIDIFIAGTVCKIK